MTFLIFFLLFFKKILGMLQPGQGKNGTQNENSFFFLFFCSDVGRVEMVPRMKIFSSFLAYPDPICLDMKLVFYLFIFFLNLNIFTIFIAFFQVCSYSGYEETVPGMIIFFSSLFGLFVGRSIPVMKIVFSPPLFFDLSRHSLAKNEYRIFRLVSARIGQK